MWWNRKRETVAANRLTLAANPPTTPQWEKPMADIRPTMSSTTIPNQKQTRLGPSTVVHGELSGNEDLVVEGQFDGTISLQDHCLTVGAQGQLKAEIHARQVIVLGSVTGNITAREKIEIRKTGRVVGDLVSAGIGIEEGAYFKGSIDIQREEAQEVAGSLPPPRALETSA